MDNTEDSKNKRKEKSKAKPKPAKSYTTRSKIEEVQGKMVDISSSIVPLQPPIVAHTDGNEAEDEDVFIPECQPNSNLPDMAQVNQKLEKYSDVTLGEVSFKYFGELLETASHFA